MEKEDKILEEFIKLTGNYLKDSIENTFNLYDKEIKMYEELLYDLESNKPFFLFKKEVRRYNKLKKLYESKLQLLYTKIYELYE